MAKASNLEPFIPVDGLKNIYAARNGNLRCIAIKLKGGGICLLSPVAGLNSPATESIKELGPVTHLLAPNYYHNKALAEYVKAYPTAQLCAPQQATPRLEKQTGLSFDDIKGLAKLLPKGADFLQPEGLKTGEVWLRIQSGKTIAWVVIDALAGDTMTAKKTTSELPGFLKTFPNYGVSDAPVYTTWFARQLKTDQPTLVIPCHGTICSNDKLPALITDLMSKYF